MPRYRNALPQLAGRTLLADGGLETTLIFHDGIELPCFAAFDLLKTDAGTERLRRYYRDYGALAREQGVGFLFDAPTWRASADWGERLGHSAAALDDMNRRSIELLCDVRDEFETPDAPKVVSGVVGPRGDGYVADRRMTAAEAERYHSRQVELFAGSDADMVAAYTLNYVEEAIGGVRAAQRVAMPVAVSFTVETDGRLPTGQSLGDAIRETDAATDGGAAYFMLNCAHPTHFAEAIATDEAWIGRLRGLRANASRMSHAELDAATELDDGDPHELGEQYRELTQRLPQLAVFGGCCGTDRRHVEAIRSACAAKFRGDV